MNLDIAEVTTRLRLRLISHILSRFSTISDIAVATVIMTTIENYEYTHTSFITNMIIYLLHKIENHDVKKNKHTCP